MRPSPPRQNTYWRSLAGFTATATAGVEPAAWAGLMAAACATATEVGARLANASRPAANANSARVALRTVPRCCGVAETIPIVGLEEAHRVGVVAERFLEVIRVRVLVDLGDSTLL